MGKIISFNGATPDKGEVPPTTVIVCRHCGSFHWVLQDLKVGDGELHAICLHCGAHEPLLNVTQLGKNL